MLKNKITILLIAVLFLVTSIFTGSLAKDFSTQEQLGIINIYQEKYFEIIRRNDVLLNFEDSTELNEDRRDLDNLFAEVEKQITNRRYLNKYKKIQNRYSKCKGITTIKINACANKNYQAINKLLNNVYQKAESRLNFEDGKKLASNELLWEKDVEDYHKVFESMGFGTIGTSIYYGYEINMREFRTLLLMLYM